MKKKLCVCLCILCLLTVGCSSKNRYEDRVIDITVEKLIKKIKGKDNFIVMFTQPYCGYCNALKKMLINYLKNNDVIIFEVNLDKKRINSKEMDALSEDIRMYFPNQHVTPDIYYVKNGEIYDHLDANAIDISVEKNFNDWIDKNQLNSDKNYLK